MSSAWERRYEALLAEHRRILKRLDEERMARGYYQRLVRTIEETLGKDSEIVQLLKEREARDN